MSKEEACYRSKMNGGSRKNNEEEENKKNWTLIVSDEVDELTDITTTAYDSEGEALTSTIKWANVSGFCTCHTDQRSNR
jgi:hypothetical protein